MDRGEFIKKFLAGLFFVLGITLLVVVVFVIGLERGLARPKFQVDVLFKEVGGLAQGAPIRISGVTVGVVGPVMFINEEIEGRSIKAELNIYKKFESQFMKCSRVGIKTEGILGEKYIEISADPAYKEFDISAPILGQEVLDVENVANVMTQTAVALQDTTVGMDQLLEDLRVLTGKTRRVLNRVEEQIIAGTLFKVF